MTRRLTGINRRNPNRPPLTRRVYCSYVAIRFDAAVQREIFLRQPARIISRRRTIAREREPRERLPRFQNSTEAHTLNVVEQPQIPSQPRAPLSDTDPNQLKKRARAKSIDVRQSNDRKYIAPATLQEAINKIRQRFGISSSQSFFLGILMFFFLLISYIGQSTVKYTSSFHSVKPKSTRIADMTRKN